MSEENEDVKPKIDLTVQFGDQSEHPALSSAMELSRVCSVSDKSALKYIVQEGFRSCRGELSGSSASCYWLMEYVIETLPEGARYVVVCYACI